MREREEVSVLERAGEGTREDREETGELEGAGEGGPEVGALYVRPPELEELARNREERQGIEDGDGEKGRGSSATRPGAITSELDLVDEDELARIIGKLLLALLVGS